MNLSGGHEAGIDEIGQHEVRAGTRRWQVDMRRELGRRLEQASQHGGFGQRDLADRLSEVELRCRLDAECAAAHVGAVKV